VVVLMDVVAVPTYKGGFTAPQNLTTTDQVYYIVIFAQDTTAAQGKSIRLKLTIDGKPPTEPSI